MMQIQSMIRSSSMPVDIQGQRGVSLLIVLVVLVVLTMIGVIAVRSSTVSLNISTNGQIVSLLNNANEAALKKFIDDFYEPTSQKNVSLSMTHPVGYLKNATETVDNAEVFFCFKPLTETRFFDVGHTYVIKPSATDDATVVTGSEAKGICGDSDYSSARKVVKTQLSMTRIKGGTCPLGTSFECNGENHYATRVFITSFIPKASVATSGDITKCFSSRINSNLNQDLRTAKESVTDCLMRIGVPAKTVVVDFDLNSAITLS